MGGWTDGEMRWRQIIIFRWRKDVERWTGRKGDGPKKEGGQRVLKEWVKKGSEGGG